MLFFLALQAATSLTSSTDAQRAAYDNYEKCIALQAALLEPSDVELSDLFLAAKARCGAEGIAMSKAVDEYALANASSAAEVPLVYSARMYGFLEQRAIDHAKPIVIAMRAKRKG